MAQVTEWLSNQQLQTMEVILSSTSESSEICAQSKKALNKLIINYCLASGN